MSPALYRIIIVICTGRSGPDYNISRHTKTVMSFTLRVGVVQLAAAHASKTLCMSIFVGTTDEPTDA